MHAVNPHRMYISVATTSLSYPLLLSSLRNRKGCAERQAQKQKFLVPKLGIKQATRSIEGRFPMWR